jgi:hypothetical protein
LPNTEIKSEKEGVLTMLFAKVKAIHRKLEQVFNAGFNLVARVAVDPQTRRLAPIVGLTLLQFTLLAVSANAQTSDTNLFGTIKTIAEDLYDKWRGPISLAGLSLAGVVLMVGGRQAMRMVIAIAGGVLVFALAPKLYETLGHWGGETVISPAHP